MGHPKKSSVSVSWKRLFGRRRGVCAGALSLRRRHSAERRHSPSNVRERRPPATTLYFTFPEIYLIFTLLFIAGIDLANHSVRMIDWYIIIGYFGYRFMSFMSAVFRQFSYDARANALDQCSRANIAGRALFCWVRGISALLWCGAKLWQWPTRPVLTCDVWRSWTTAKSWHCGTPIYWWAWICCFPILYWLNQKKILDNIFKIGFCCAWQYSLKNWNTYAW